MGFLRLVNVQRYDVSVESFRSTCGENVQVGVCGCPREGLDGRVIDGDDEVGVDVVVAAGAKAG